MLLYPGIYGELIFDKGAKTIQWGTGAVSSVRGAGTTGHLQTTDKNLHKTDQRPKQKSKYCKTLRRKHRGKSS